MKICLVMRFRWACSDALACRRDIGLYQGAPTPVEGENFRRQPTSVGAAVSTGQLGTGRWIVICLKIWRCSRDPSRTISRSSWPRIVRRHGCRQLLGRVPIVHQHVGGQRLHRDVAHIIDKIGHRVFCFDIGLRPRVARLTHCRSLRGSGVLPFFKKLPSCLVGIEACGTSHSGM